MSWIKEFKEFATRGSIVDLAVAVVIGGAFGKIVTAFVENLLMPPIAYLMGGASTDKLVWMVNEKLSISYGLFLQALIDFVIIAFAIFWVVKMINKFNKKEEEAPEEKAEDIKLLEEIRDLLKK